MPYPETPYPCPMDLLQEYAVLGSMDLHTLSPVLLADRSHVRQLQLDDSVTCLLLRDLERYSQAGTEEKNPAVCRSQWATVLQGP